MAVKIKPKRSGKIRNPQYRIVVADSRTKRDGRAIEEIGRYEPAMDPSLIEVDSDRVQYWLGSVPSPPRPCAPLLRVTGDWQKFTQEPGSEGDAAGQGGQGRPTSPWRMPVQSKAAKIGDQPAKPKLAPKNEDVADAKKSEAAEIAEGNAKVAELAEAETAAENWPRPPTRSRIRPPKSRLPRPRLRPTSPEQGVGDDGRQRGARASGARGSWSTRRCGRAGAAQIVTAATASPYR